MTAQTLPAGPANSALLPRGRPAALILMDVERNLTANDVARVALGTPTPVAPPIIQKLKHSHHAAARMVAQGLDYKTVAAQMGYTPQRVSDLATKDPAFQNLVAYYADQMTETDIVTGQRIRDKLLDIAETATDEIAARLDDPAKIAGIPMDELRRAAEFGLDRTVLPPKTSTPMVVVPQHITFKIGTRDIRSSGPDRLIDISPGAPNLPLDQKGDGNDQGSERDPLANGSSPAPCLDGDSGRKSDSGKAPALAGEDGRTRTD